jgi:hypothetical protein
MRPLNTIHSCASTNWFLFRLRVLRFRRLCGSVQWTKLAGEGFSRTEFIAAIEFIHICASLYYG